MRLGLTLALLLWSVSAFGQVLPTPDKPVNVKMNVVRCIDADTLVGDVTMDEPWRGHSFNFPWDVKVEPRDGEAHPRVQVKVTLQSQRVRIVGVDAHELSTDKGKIAKLSVEKLLVGKTVKLTPRGKDSFGRLLAIVTLVDKDGGEVVLADWLIKHKHGIVYKDSR